MEHETKRSHSLKITLLRDSASSTSEDIFQAFFLEIEGSYPITSIPSILAAFAISTPIAPRPTIPKVFPGNSDPEYCFLPSSTVALRLSSGRSLT